MTDLRALCLSDDHWHSRWLVLPTWNRLHRISDDMKWEDEDDMRRGIGTTLCRRRGLLVMPGMLSRLGLPRCAHCCRLAGVPRGDGAPFNQGIEEGTQ